VPLEIAARIGSREMKGQVSVRAEAAETYEDAVAQGDSAVLVSRAADGLLSASLGNLLPGETAEIRLRYGQLLEVREGAVRIALPTVIAPRYGDPANAGLEPFAAPETSLAAQYPLALTLDLHGALANAAVSCATHSASFARAGDALRITVARASLDRDVVILAEQLPAGAEGYSAVARDGAHYVALASFLAPAARHEAMPLAVKVLVDCSGSMNGDSIHQARAALARFVAELGEADRVSLTRFGSTVAHSRASLAPLRGEDRRRLRHAIGTLEADLGGTEMESALRTVYDIPVEGGGAAVLLITDGEIHATDAVIAGACASGHRLFVVAVGASPAESWLARLAEETGGAIEFVTPREDIEAAVRRLAHRIRTPRQSLGAVRWPGRHDIVGPVPASVYEGETVHAFARLLDQPLGEVRAEFAAGAVTMRLPAEVAATDTLARLFAAQRLRHETDATQRRALALAYQLLTEDTSWILTLERAADEKGSAVPVLAKVPQMMAAGWGGVGAVALPSVVGAQRMLSASLCMESASYQPIEEPEEISLAYAPAFEPLRRESELARRLSASLRHANVNQLPTTLNELAALGVDDAVLEPLRAEVFAGAPESLVVLAFLQGLVDQQGLLLDCEAELKREIGRERRRAGQQLRRSVAEALALAERDH
jgi:Ca-activated chloride channel family protein